MTTCPRGVNQGGDEGVEGEQTGELMCLHILGNNQQNSEPDCRVTKRWSKSSGRSGPPVHLLNSVPWKLRQRQRHGYNGPHAPNLSFRNYQPTFVKLVSNPYPLFFPSGIFKQNFIYHIISPPNISISCPLLRLSDNKYPIRATGKSAMLFLIQMWYRMFNYSRAEILVK